MGKGKEGGGAHDNKAQHDGSKSGGGSGKFENPDKGGKHSGGGKDKK